MEYNVFVYNLSNAHNFVNKHYVSKIDDTFFMYSIYCGGLRNENIIGTRHEQLLINKYIAEFKKESTCMYFKTNYFFTIILLGLDILV
jgi:hypothetical protein